MSSLQNPIHSHTLFLRNLSQHFQAYLQGNESDYDAFIMCDFCGEDIVGSTSIYCCELCGFYVHPSCATPPLRQIQHPRHKHLLDLQVPDKESQLFYYRCVEFDDGCDFELRASIAMKTLWVEKYYCSMLREVDDGESRLQFAHEHPLTTFAVRPQTSCGGCREHISEEAYGCRECNFFLHEACAKPPLDVQSHPSHPEHPLHLFCNPVDFHKTDGLACCKCEIEFSVGYCCENCSFFLDLSCARKEITRRSSVMDHYLHEHQLSLQSKPKKKIVCSVCEDRIPGGFFGCSGCSFFLHESCAQPPMEVQHYLHPEHILTFAQLTSKKYHKCPICLCPVTRDSYCYTCQMCDFFIHQTCASATLSDLEKGVSMTVQCAFHEHELKLYYCDRYMEDCEVCEGTINRRTLAYKCYFQGCSFKLHKSCSQLLPTLEHPSHLPHPLTLCFEPPKEGMVCCGCYRKINDRCAFSCGECNFHLHRHCARKPTLEHAFHEHSLFYFDMILKPLKYKADKLYNFECRTCLKSCGLDFFHCVQCDYSLHYACSQLAPTIKSKHHIDPLVLRESVIEDDSEEYYCDICERRRDPKKWVYYCETCSYKFIAHIDCALSPVNLEVIEEDDFIKRKEDIQRREKEIKLVKEEVDAEEANLRPLMAKLKLVRAKMKSKRAELKKLKTEHAKWIGMEGIKGEEGADTTDGESGSTAGEGADTPDGESGSTAGEEDN